MIKNEFYHLEWEVNKAVIFLIWLPTSINMSKDDFVQHVVVLNNLINANYARILFIDATAFKARIERSFMKKLQYIEEPSSLKWILYTSPGKSMKRLIRRLKSEDITIREYANQDELQRFFNEITEKN